MCGSGVTQTLDPLTFSLPAQQTCCMAVTQVLSTCPLSLSLFLIAHIIRRQKDSTLLHLVYTPPNPRA